MPIKDLNPNITFGGKMPADHYEVSSCPNPRKTRSIEISNV